MTRSVRIRLPVSERVDELLEKYRHVSQQDPRAYLPTGRNRVKLIETALRYSARYHREEDPTFAPNGRYLDIHLKSPELLGMTPRALGAHLQREILEFDGRFRPPSPSTDLDTLELLLADETLWAIRVRAFHEGRSVQDLLTDVAHRSLLEMRLMYERAGARRELVPVKISSSTFREVNRMVHAVGGHPYFALQHHMTLKVGATQAVPA
jgi:hypothetical protein